MTNIDAELVGQIASAQKNTMATSAHFTGFGEPVAKLCSTTQTSEHAATSIPDASKGGVDIDVKIDDSFNHVDVGKIIKTTTATPKPKLPSWWYHDHRHANTIDKDAASVQARSEPSGGVDIDIDIDDSFNKVKVGKVITTAGAKPHPNRWNWHDHIIPWKPTPVTTLSGPSVVNVDIKNDHGPSHVGVDKASQTTSHCISRLGHDGGVIPCLVARNETNTTATLATISADADKALHALIGCGGIAVVAICIFAGLGMCVKKCRARRNKRAAYAANQLAMIDVRTTLYSDMA